jgi:hypothetical protein
MLLHGNAMPLARRPFGGESCLEFSDSRMVSRYTSVEMIDRTYGHLASRAGPSRSERVVIATAGPGRRPVAGPGA